MQANWKPLVLATASAIGILTAATAVAYNDSWQAAATGNSFSQSTAPEAVVVPLYRVNAVNLVTTGQPVVVVDRSTGVATEVVAIAPAVATSTLVVGPAPSLVTTYRSASYSDWMRGDIRTEVVPVTDIRTEVVPVTRQVYVNDLGQQFVAVGIAERGLTPAEASHIYGNVDSSAGPTLTGTGVQPGNMGPGNAKGQ